MPFDFVVTNAAFKPRSIIDRQNAAFDSERRRMCYHTASEAFKAAARRKKETGHEFSVWVNNTVDPFATTATWGIIDKMKLIK